MTAFDSPQSGDAFFRQVAEHTYGATFITTADAVFTWMSPSIRDVLGWEPDEMVGHRSLEFVHPNDLENLLGQMSEVSAGRSVDFRQRMRARDGTYRWIGVAVRPVLDEQGNVVQRVGNFRDVTEHVKADHALTASERRYQEIAENVRDIVLRGSGLVIEWVSPSVHTVLGWAPEELVGRTPTDLTHPMDRERALAGDVGMQVRLATKSGDYRWMAITVGDVFTTDSGDAWVAVWRDVTDERRARDELASNAERLRTTVQSAPAGLCTVALDGSFITVNPAMCRLLGRSEEELLTSGWQDVTHPDDLGIGREQFEDLVKGAWPTFRTMKRYVRPSGETIWADLSVSCIRSDDGHVKYFIAHLVDMTEAIEAQQDLARSEDRYRGLVETLGEAVLTRGLDGRITFASSGVRDLLGWEPEDLVGMVWLDLTHPDDRAPLTDMVARLHDSGKLTGRARIRCKNGDYRWVESAGQFQRSEDGEVVGVIATWRDARPQMDRELHASLEIARLSTVTDYVGDIVVRLQYGVISWVSPAITSELGGPAEDWIGLHLRNRVHPDDLGEFRYARQLIIAGESAKLRLRLKGMDGDYHWLSGIITSTGGGTADDVIVSLRVIDDVVAKEKASEDSARTDTLTGLANRRELLEQLDSMLNRHRHHKHVAVIFCDLDDLQHVNDSLGYHAGDLVLSGVARNLRAILRRDDVPARVGTDEFAIAMAAIADPAHALATAETVRAAIGSPIDVPESSPVTVTASIGVALGRAGEDPAELLRRADAAMREAKRSGGDRIVVST